MMLDSLPARSSCLQPVLNGVAQGEVRNKLVHWRNWLAAIVGANSTLPAMLRDASVTKGVTAGDCDGLSNRLRHIGQT